MDCVFRGKRHRLMTRADGPGNSRKHRSDVHSIAEYKESLSVYILGTGSGYCMHVQFKAYTSRLHLYLSDTKSVRVRV